ncbi:MAG: 50S ribosomal protein L21 [Bacteriovoracaceae bacterium]|jgi:large subunit ribosomal protein L21|nr:50S ribosomal protein L21 [Halobacteriovoraceae bacterium]MDP7319493.1 50S ribosomal protein L21 [Bacteriovoracaceae bacterium]
MYSVVEIQGHQYRVKEGDIVDVQKMDAEVGSTVELDKVLFVGGETPKVGTPVVDGAKVTAEVVRQARSRKVIVFKRKAGLSRTKNGHRQHYTALKITGIKA